LKSFSGFVKTSHHKNKSAAAWTQHVSILIFDFNFAKIIISLSLNAHINALNKLISLFWNNTIFRVLHSVASGSAAASSASSAGPDVASLVEKALAKLYI
jgi:hypothetical protein